MVIIVTGAIGVGKTSVCRKLIEIALNQGFTCGGILTDKATPKYSFNPRGIDFGLQAIAKGVSADILVVDEFGHLELRGEGFARALDIIKAGKIKNCILVIRTELLPAFLPLLPPNPLIFEATLENRDQLPEEIANKIIKRKQ